MPDEFAIVLIAPDRDPDAAAVEAALRTRTQSLAASGDRITFVTDNDLTAVPAGATAAAILFGRGRLTLPQQVAVADCLSRGLPVFPVVADLEQFNQLVPDALHPFNGFRMEPAGDPHELAGLILETLGLQRGRRKIFISYARTDASAMTAQLREALTGRWYAAFHDTISIRPGRLFQAELLQELTDSDVFLLLNSPNVATRPYVQEEIAFAMCAGLGGVQLVWPGAPPRRDAMFTVMDLAQPGRFTADWRLTPAGIDDVLQMVAHERTAFQRQREAEMEGAVRAYAVANRMVVTAHMGRYFEVTGSAGPVRLDVALGLPTSLELARAIRDPRAYVVYDPLGITSPMADHLALLAAKFPLALLSVRDSLAWPALA